MMVSKITKFLIPRAPKTDRRVKLSLAQKDDIRRNENGLGVRALAREYGVSPRTIQFILDPSKREANMEARKARGGHYQYYSTEKNTAYQNKHREHKKTLLALGLLEEK